MSQVSAFPALPHEEPPLPTTEVQKQTLLDYLTAFGLASQLTQEEKLQFIEVAQAFRLNPFKREIHVAAYGEGEYRHLSLITGYEVYLKRAERTGKLDGWKAWVEGTGDTMKALVEIHRRDWSQPFTHEVYWSEAVQRTKAGSLTSFWSKMPRFQLKKVCISQAFRLAFPDELGGLPYDASELPDGEALSPASVLSPLPGAQPEAATSESAPSPKVSSTLDEPPLQPEALASAAMPSSAAPTIRFYDYQDPYPDEPQDALLVRLEHYLDDNNMAFTERHRDWIFEKAKQSRDRHGVLKMISYSEKVVRNTSAAASA
ncbi:MAG TPA: phage recombination protein Bet [Armatimonadota bacterium]|nr:phage recombination protein Bet [Armatimonadota bacterium]